MEIKNISNCKLTNGLDNKWKLILDGNVWHLIKANKRKSYNLGKGKIFYYVSINKKYYMTMLKFDEIDIIKINRVEISIYEIDKTKPNHVGEQVGEAIIEDYTEKEFNYKTDN